MADALRAQTTFSREQFSDDAEIRKSLRGLMQKRAAACSKASTRMRIPSIASIMSFPSPLQNYRAIRFWRSTAARRRGFLKVGLDMDRDAAIHTLRRLVVKPGSPAMTFVAAAAEDSYDRLIFRSLEREIRNLLTDARPTEPRSATLPSTSSRCSCSRPSKASSPWDSTPATATAARSPSWMRPVRC